MADQREAPARSRAAGAAGEWTEIASSALLVGATAAILLTGFALRSEPMRERAAPLAAKTPAPLPPQAPIFERSPVAELAPPPLAPAEAELAPPMKTRPAAAPLDPRLASLARRAVDDALRIGRATGGWTAQIVVACKTDTVARRVGSAKGSSKLYVLPVELDGSSCFRVCWGSYGSAKDAVAAKDLPAGVRGGETVRAVEIAKIRP